MVNPAHTVDQLMLEFQTVKRKEDMLKKIFYIVCHSIFILICMFYIHVIPTEDTKLNTKSQNLILGYWARNLWVGRDYYEYNFPCFRLHIVAVRQFGSVS